MRQSPEPLQSNQAWSVCQKSLKSCLSTIDLDHSCDERRDRGDALAGTKLRLYRKWGNWQRHIRQPNGRKERIGRVRNCYYCQFWKVFSRVVRFVGRKENGCFCDSKFAVIWKWCLEPSVQYDRKWIPIYFVLVWYFWKIMFTFFIISLQIFSQCWWNT